MAACFKIVVSTPPAILRNGNLLPAKPVRSHKTACVARFIELRETPGLTGPVDRDAQNAGYRNAQLG